MDNTAIISLIIYIVISFISILLHDLKYLFFLNTNNRLKAVTICVVYTILNTWITKNIATQPLEISLPVITITNGISMWIAMWYSEKSLKEYVYNWEITTKYPNIRFELKNRFKELNIPYEYFYYYFENNKNNEEEKAKGIEINEFGEALYHKYIIHAFSKEHSKRLENILKQYDYSKVKYIKTQTSSYIEK